MLTAKDTEYDRVAGMDTGAGDDISRPSVITEPSARERTVMTEPESRPDTGAQISLIYGDQDTAEDL